ncbi:MAG TPA: hypothetical protein VF471_13385 [Pseudoxanthomonas sp.]
MMDGVLSGLLGGMLADPLGNYLCRFRYRAVFLGGFSLTFIGFGFFYLVVTLHATFFDGKEVLMGRLFSLDMLLMLICISLLGATLGVFLKACAPLLTWQEAEAILRNTGYVRTVGEEAEVIFTKEKVRFIARNATSVVPERIECWKNGIRKLDVILRPRPARNR